jgi:hypothetical protein
MAVLHPGIESEEEQKIIDLKAQRIGGWLKKLIFSPVTYESERKLNVSREAECREKIIGEDEARSIDSGLEAKRI